MYINSGDAVIQILMNLLFNAADSTADKGIITFELMNVADRVELRVSDNGSGISKSDQNKIFDPEEGWEAAPAWDCRSPIAWHAHFRAILSWYPATRVGRPSCLLSPV